MLGASRVVRYLLRSATSQGTFRSRQLQLYSHLQSCIVSCIGLGIHKGHRELLRAGFPKSDIR